VGRRPSSDAGKFGDALFSDPGADFDVVSVSRDDEVIVALRGEVDLATAPLLERSGLRRHFTVVAPHWA
jgi:hypothetical protein